MKLLTQQDHLRETLQLDKINQLIVQEIEVS